MVTMEVGRTSQIGILIRVTVTARIVHEGAAGASRAWLVLTVWIC